MRPVATPEDPLALYDILTQAEEENPLVFLARTLINGDYRLVNRESLSQRDVVVNPPEEFTLLNIKDYLFLSRDALCEQEGFKIQIIREDGTNNTQFVEKFSEISGLLQNMSDPMFKGDVLIRVLPS